MKNSIACAGFLVVAFLTQSVFAVAPLLVDVDSYLDYRQTNDPELFFPPVATQEATQAGSDWYFRYFTGSETYIAVNRSGGGGFTQGGVYGLGGAFGNSVIFLGLLSDLLGSIPDNSVPLLADVDKLLNFAETVEPGLFSPPTTTAEATEAGSDWFFRFYSATQTYIAVNKSGGPGFTQGGVYALGGSFGSEVVFVGLLIDLLALVPNDPGPGGESRITNAGNGNCAILSLPTEGVIAEFRSTSFVGNLEIISNYSTRYVAVSNSEITTERIEIRESAGYVVTTTTVGTNFFETEGDLRYTTAIESDETSVTVGGPPPIPDSSSSTDLSFDPRLFMGPANSQCEEQEWYSAPVTQTIEVSPPIPPTMIVVNTFEATTVVNSINSEVEVEAGSFNTVETTRTFPDSSTVTFADPTTGIEVLTNSYDSGGFLTSTTELLEITQ